MSAEPLTKFYRHGVSDLARDVLVRSIEYVVVCERLQTGSLP